MKLEATFVGKDGSLGYREGTTYTVDYEEDGKYIWVNKNRFNRCPYSNRRLFKANWSVIRHI